MILLRRWQLAVRKGVDRADVDGAMNGRFSDCKERPINGHSSCSGFDNPEFFLA
jgi:hypothetical protein